jgi:hypothetical protein
MDVPSDGGGVPRPEVGEASDPLSRMTAYSLAVELVDECWRDVERLNNVHRQVEKLGRICRLLLSVIPRERDLELRRGKR